MEPTKELVDELYREEVMLARETPPGEKLIDGPRLFDRVCRIMESGIRDQHPSATDEQVKEMLLDRLRLSRRLALGWPEGAR